MPAIRRDVMSDVIGYTMDETTTTTNQDNQAEETTTVTNAETTTDNKDDGNDLVTKLRNQERELNKRLAAAEKQLRQFKQAEEARENEKLSEIERANKAKAELEAELNQLKFQSAKSNALDLAISSLGQGFTVDRKAVVDILDGMTIDADNLEAKIEQIVNLAKQPVKGTKAISGQPAADDIKSSKSSVPYREDAMSYTNDEMRRLATEDPDRYQKVRQLRIQHVQRKR